VKKTFFTLIKCTFCVACSTIWYWRG